MLIKRVTLKIYIIKLIPTGFSYKIHMVMVKIIDQTTLDLDQSNMIKNL